MKFFILLTILITQITNVAFGANLTISPSAITLPDVGNTLKVTVDIDDVEDLGGFQFDLLYDPSVVTLENINDIIILSEDLLSTNGRKSSTLGPDINNQDGIVTLGAFSYGAQSGYNAYTKATSLVEATFKVRSQSNSNISLNNVLLSDTSANPILVNKETGAELVIETNPDDGGGGTCFVCSVLIDKIHFFQFIVFAPFLFFYFFHFRKYKI